MKSGVEIKTGMLQVKTCPDPIFSYSLANKSHYGFPSTFISASHHDCNSMFCRRTPHSRRETPLETLVTTRGVGGESQTTQRSLQ